MEFTASDLWSRILQLAQTGLPEQSFNTWLSGTGAVAVSEGELQVEAPSQFHVEWIEDKFGQHLREAAQRVLGRPIRISISSSDSLPFPTVPSLEVTPGSPNVHTPPSPRAHGDSPGPALNTRYTFERFVVGGDNELAAAAAGAVAERPARMYNPLFLYGGVGLGKTHLMHAIGNAILTADPRTKVAYAPCEHFTNELVTSIKEGTMPDFRRRYRMMDLLLLDDVHFLGNKDRTQEEFFHTFNALYDARKQIVLASDRPPKDIPGLEERLISRFEWGLVADIKAPDYETRVAILRKKAEDDGLAIDPEVIDFIARACTSSVRELEGAVIKLLAYSSVRNQEVSVTLAQAALKGVLRQSSAKTSRRVFGSDIREAVAKEWGVETRALTSAARTKDLTVPRQVGMYLMREILDLPLKEIGSHFGGRDHSTVIHSIKKVEGSLEHDPDLAERVARLREELSESM
jgi:chromosomal replication initiator protein